MLVWYNLITNHIFRLFWGFPQRKSQNPAQYCRISIHSLHITRIRGDNDEKTAKVKGADVITSAPLYFERIGSVNITIPGL